MNMKKNLGPRAFKLNPKWINKCPWIAPGGGFGSNPNQTANPHGPKAQTIQNPKRPQGTPRGVGARAWANCQKVHRVAWV